MTDTVTTAVPARPSAGAINRVQAPAGVHVVANVEGATGSSVVFEEDRDVRNAEVKIAPVMVNGTLTEPF